MMLTRGRQNDSEKNVSMCHFFHRGRTVLGANPALQGKKPAIDRVHYINALYSLLFILAQILILLISFVLLMFRVIFGNIFCGVFISYFYCQVS